MDLFLGRLAIPGHRSFNHRRSIVSNGQASFAHGNDQATPRLAQLGRRCGVFAEERSFNRALVWGVFADEPRHLIKHVNQPILERIFLEAGADTAAGNIADLALAIFDEAVASARAARIYPKNKQSGAPLGLSHEFFEFVFAEIEIGKDLLYVV